MSLNIGRNFRGFPQILPFRLRPILSRPRSIQINYTSPRSVPPTTFAHASRYASFFPGAARKPTKQPQDSKQKSPDDDLDEEISSVYTPEQLKAFQELERPRSEYDDNNSPFEITSNKDDPEFPTEDEIAAANIPAGLKTYSVKATCMSCSTRSGYFVAQQAYHQGTVILFCSDGDCGRGHIFIDNLKVCTSSLCVVVILV